MNLNQLNFRFLTYKVPFKDLEGNLEAFVLLIYLLFFLKQLLLV